MSKRKHPILHDYDDYYRTPRQIIDALADARDEFTASNYHCGLFDMAEQIVRAWCKCEGVPVGATKATVQRRAEQKRERDFERKWGPALALASQSQPPADDGDR